MNALQASELFNDENHEDATKYLEAEGLISSIYEVADEINRIPPDFEDLARLHYVVRHRKVFSVLEFGIGFSTIVIADAIQKNEP